MEQCSIDELIGDKRAIMMEDGEIESFAVYEHERPISILRQMPYAIAVKRRHESILDNALGFSFVNMEKEKASCVFSMMTRPDKSHLGLSDEVMYEALLRQREQGRAFTYHNPENMQEMIQYEQFGFAPVADNKLYIRKRQYLQDDILQRCLQGEKCRIAETEYEISLFDTVHMQQLLKLVNCELGMRYGIFAIRTVQYYEKLLDDMTQYQGQMFLLWEKDAIVGYFAMEDVFANEICREALFIRDEIGTLLFEEQNEGLPVLARIVNIRSMVRHICSDGNVTVAVRMEDPMLAANNGTYIWYLNERGSRMELVESSQKALPRPELSVTIGEFTSILFGYKEVKNNRKFESIRLLGPIWLPERN